MKIFRHASVVLAMLTLTTASASAQVAGAAAGGAEALRKIEAERQQKALVEAQIEAMRRASEIAAQQLELDKRKVALQQAEIARAASGDAKEVSALLVAAKATGACGVLQSMAVFQATTRMDGGDAFLARFIRTEVTRLGTNVDDYLQMCQRATELYDKTAASLGVSK